MDNQPESNEQLEENSASNSAPALSTSAHSIAKLDNEEQENAVEHAVQNESRVKTNTKNEDSKQYDIVLYGATSFVGKLTAAYLHEFLTDKTDKESTETEQSMTWAIAGRNKEKLNDVNSALEGDDVPIIIADSEEQASLDAMAKQARVIISTVGPYLFYGEPLIKACVEHGTDYVDLTGEAIFIKKIMDKYQQQAGQTGARIVNSCGFDSIPSDLGVYFTQLQAYAQYHEYCDTIHMRVKAAKGGVSGGTVASMATIFSEVGQDKSKRRQLADPYLLNDDERPPNVRQTANKIPKLDKKNQHWQAPFVMESINTRIVHRSNQCLGYLYGRNFKYDEALWMPSGLKGRLMSYTMTAGIAGFAVAMSFDKSRKLLNEYVLPKSGDGPSKEERDNGYFDIRFFGLINGQQKIKTKVTGDRDPGYGSTCRMLAQSALCLAQDVAKTEVAGGFWTPASAMGEALIVRLEAYAGVSFDVISLENKTVSLEDE